MKKLTLSLKKQWFEMTKAGIKSEDYREINQYWLKRLFYYNSAFELDQNMIDEVVCELRNGKCNTEEISRCFDFHPKRFEFNIMTLGYPKSTDTDRIIKFKHKGIEIREGNPDWGAKPGKLYFVIKHGKIINE